MKVLRIAAVLLLIILPISVSIPNMFHSTSRSIMSEYFEQTPVIDNPIVITNNAELATLSSGGVGTRSNPYIIEGLDIESINCLSIAGTTAFFVIRDSVFTYQTGGDGEAHTVSFTDVEHGKIESCYVRGGDVAIFVSSSSDFSIVNCMTFGAYNGVAIDGSINCTITESRSFDNRNGIMLVGSTSCKIINNSIYGNTETGVYVYAFCANNTIAGNSIGWNNNANAIDNGINTEFDDGVVFGNDWSDFIESEDYEIQGLGNSTDYFAGRLTDGITPVLYGVQDIVIDVESSGETITWTASDDFHFRYEIWIDNTLLVTEPWDGRSITLRLDGFDVGTYSIAISVFDGAGNVASDEVEMSVISFVLGGIGTELVMFASGVTVICFVVIILIIKRYI